jgi:hypothetical protein
MALLLLQKHKNTKHLLPEIFQNLLKYLDIPSLAHQNIAQHSRILYLHQVFSFFKLLCTLQRRGDSESAYVSLRQHTLAYVSIR